MKNNLYLTIFRLKWQLVLPEYLLNPTVKYRVFNIALISIPKLQIDVVSANPYSFYIHKKVIKLWLNQPLHKAASDLASIIQKQYPAYDHPLVYHIFNSFLTQGKHLPRYHQLIFSGKLLPTIAQKIFFEHLSTKSAGLIKSARERIKRHENSIRLLRGRIDILNKNNGN